MHFFSPRLPQQADDLPGGSTPDDGVVDHNHPPALDCAPKGTQLDADGLFPALLVRGDKGAADVTVLHKALAVRNAGLLGIAHGGIQAGVRHADDHVGVHRVLPGQDAAGLQAGLVDGLPADHRVGPGKVNVFKDTHV